MTGPRVAERSLPRGTDVMAREAMWWAWATGSPPPDTSAPPPTWEAYPEDDVPAPPLPEAAARAGGRPLPFGTVDLLDALPYPSGRVTGGAGKPGEVDDRLGHALVAAFGLHRREPGNPFNDHRGYASVRSRFPVHAFVRDACGDAVLDVYWHRLADLPSGARRAATPGGRALEVALAGRWTRLPAAYRWFRGSLVGLEAGIALRSLCLALELLGLSGRVRPPDARTGEGLLGELGLEPTEEWSLPLVLELAAGGRPKRPAAAPVAHPARPADLPDDPVLRQVLAIDRAQSGASGPAAADALGPAVPARLPGRHALSWAQVLWQRTSGRMPRGLYGMGGRPRRLPAEVLLDLAAWAALPPPGGLAQAAFDAVTATAVVQGVDGYADGVYRVREGVPALLRADGSVARLLEAEYGYPLAPGNGCDVRHASTIWFLSVHPRRLVAGHGPGAWTAAQHACGWISHGVCLAAAAHGLYARPVRAFQEVPAQRLLGLDPDEMVVLAVVSGTPRHPLPLLDLRT